jgi:hypothetical protein
MNTLDTYEPYLLYMSHVSYVSPMYELCLSFICVMSPISLSIFMNTLDTSLKKSRIYLNKSHESHNKSHVSHNESHISLNLAYLSISHISQYIMLSTTEGRTCVCMYIYHISSVCMYAHISYTGYMIVCVCVCQCVYVCTYIRYQCVHVCTYIIYQCVCVCTYIIYHCVCMYINIYLSIQSHTSHL